MVYYFGQTEVILFQAEFEESGSAKKPEFRIFAGFLADCHPCKINNSKYRGFSTITLKIKVERGRNIQLLNTYRSLNIQLLTDHISYNVIVYIINIQFNFFIN